jgi:predicted nucleotidyltransferase
MSSKEKIIKILGERRPELKSRFSVTKIGLFGSYARNAALPESDIDLLVELSHPTFDNYMDLKFYLEELLESPVGLVLSDSLKPRLIPYVTSEVIYA